MWGYGACSLLAYDPNTAESNGKANGTRNETGLCRGGKEFRDLGAQRFHGFRVGGPRDLSLVDFTQQE